MLDNKPNKDRNTLPDLTVDNFLEEFSLVTIGEIVEKVKNHVMITNAQREILWVNESFSQRSGYLRHEVLGKKPHEFLFDPVECTPTETSSSVELRCKAKNNETYWLQIDISPVFNEKNTLIGYTAIGNDITEKKQKDDLLQKHKLNIRAAARQKLKLLEEPVMIMMELMQLMKKSEDADEKETHLKELHNNLISIRNMLSELNDKVSNL